MAARPQINVYSSDNASEVVKRIALPGVFTSPIRPDIVNDVHTALNKNNRQAYAVNKIAGKLHSAESWGTGRAVARIPRISGGGTHAAGSGAFGNMCRHGRMFAPTKTWRKWHQQANVNQRRYAVASALAASTSNALVQARGHRISQVPELPLILSNNIESTIKTANAMKILGAFGADEDVEKVRASRSIRKGKGKMRNRRHVARRGPLVVYGNDEGIVKAFRNIPGIELQDVTRLNLLQLAPGGHVGRFVIWTQSTAEKLDSIWGTQRKGAAQKRGYQLPRSSVSNADLARIINSDEIQSVVRPARSAGTRFTKIKRNPLKNVDAMVKLDPSAKGRKRREARNNERGNAKRQAKINKVRKSDTKKAAKKQQVNSKKFYGERLV